MKINANKFNADKFNSLTGRKWINEEMELFKCGKCKLIVLGIPSCHVAYIDPLNLTKTMNYNLPRNITCPNCKSNWYKVSENTNYKTEEISEEELRNSNWNTIIQIANSP
jgi:Zn finger protein HypA/HybF involved in hydrogenase expression